MSWISKRVVANTVLVCVGIFAALTVAEGIVRLLPEPPKRESVFDPVLLRKLPPGGEIDENGWRNPEVQDRYDIIAIGDSQTFGSQATSEESWPAHLARISGKSVYQMALGSYGAVQYSYLTEQALAFEPKTIAWGFYVGNDLFDAYHTVYGDERLTHWAYLRRDEFRKAAPLPVVNQALQPTVEQLKDSVGFVMRARLFLREHSALYAFLGDATRTIRERAGMVEKREEATYYAKVFASQNPDVSVAYEHETLGTVFAAGERARLMDLKDTRIGEGLRLTREMIQRTADLLSEKRVSFVVVFFPTKEAAYEKLVKNQAVPEPYTRILENEQRIKENILPLCIEKQIRCIDLLPDMQKALAEGKQVYPSYHDDHPLPLGYAIIADRVRQLLSSEQTP